MEDGKSLEEQAKSTNLRNKTLLNELNEAAEVFVFSL